MTDQSFFEESTEQSQIKARIVSKYFWAWASVIKSAAKKGSNRIAYMDLFAGPGRYKDGTTSTPLLVLKQAIADPDMRSMLVTVFNDADPRNSSTLRDEIEKLPGVERLKYKPTVRNDEIGSDLVKVFESSSLIPTLFFVDPWGYKGLSLGLINSVLRNWGCDCVFFFNYNRINMGLGNEAVREHMNVLFGPERANKLRDKLVGLTPAVRELTIVEEISQALRQMGGEFVLPFGFSTEGGERTSHHLIFVTKHFRGYEIMKEIMAKESSEEHQGVASFIYSPASTEQPLLFELLTPLDELGAQLLKAFAGQTISMQQIYERHSVGKPYIKRNYKDVLLKLEAAGTVGTKPPADERPKKKGQVTFGDSVLVTFPSGGRDVS